MQDFARHFKVKNLNPSTQKKLLIIANNNYYKLNEVSELISPYELNLTKNPPFLFVFEF